MPRKPNTAYERDARLYAKLPQALCDRLDAYVLTEKRRRRPTPFDKSLAVEEAITEYLKRHRA